MLNVDERPGLNQIGMLEQKFSLYNCSLNHKRLQSLPTLIHVYTHTVHDLSSDLNRLPTGFSEFIMSVIDLISRTFPRTYIENKGIYSLVLHKSKLI